MSEKVSAERARKSGVKRDPRVDPKPGDVLIYGPQWQQERAEVIIANRGGVICKNCPASCTLRQWREWMRDAEVLHAAD